MSSSWLIEEVCPAKETVHLVKSGTSIRRKFSVPGAVDAWMEGEYLIIASNTGYLWKITPENGHRRRDMQPMPAARASRLALICPV
jgi:hypothetical protein